MIPQPQNRLLCRKCDNWNTVNARFCNVCGHRFEQDEYAGFWKRVLALCIDGIILGPVLAVIAAMIAGPPPPEVRDYVEHPEYAPLPEPAIRYWWLIVWGYTNIIGGGIYFALMECSRFQGTVGKRIVGIKVTDLDGHRISLGRAILRYLARLLSMGSFYVGFLIAAFTERKQALHDIITKCLVVNRG